MAGPTKKQLERFVAKRNRSSFSSNLQFIIDAHEAGFDPDELGPVSKRESGGYSWTTQHGQLVEHPDGQMELIAGAQVSA